MPVAGCILEQEVTGPRYVGAQRDDLSTSRREDEGEECAAGLCADQRCQILNLAERQSAVSASHDLDDPNRPKANIVQHEIARARACLDADPEHRPIAAYRNDRDDEAEERDDEAGGSDYLGGVHDGQYGPPWG